MQNGRLTTAVSLAVLLTYAGVTTVGAQQPITVRLAPPPEGGRAYTATVADAGDGRTRVEIRIDQLVRDEHTPAGDFTARLQAGTCAAPDQARIFPLTNVREGYSLTELDVPFAQLAAAPHAIVIDRAADDPKGPYLACGALATTGPSAAGAPAPQAVAGTPGPQAAAAEAAGADRAVPIVVASLAGLGLVIAAIRYRPRRRRR